MKQISKKEIRKSIEDAVSKVLFKFKTSATGRKGEKLLDIFSRKYATEVKKSIKRNVAEAPKSKAPKRVVAKKPVKK